MTNLEELFSGADFLKTKRELAKLNPADLKRIADYARDLCYGLNEIRSYPQGVTIFGSARTHKDDPLYEQARQLGQLLANNGHAVTTGGGPGVMEAANRGAYEYGGRSIGFNIVLPHEQHINPYLTDSLEFEYFFARKVMLAMCSKVYVYFPGGFGTMDELSELLVLMQENKMPKMPIFLIGRDFWKPLDKFYQSRLVQHGFIKAKDLQIYQITDDIREVVKAANRIGHPKISENLYDEATII